MSNNGHIKTESEPVPAPKTKEKRGRKKKSTEENENSTTDEKPALKQEMITDHMSVVKKKRKIDRFNGIPEEEVIQMTLPDRLAPNLDILIIGINPGLFAAYIGHHYAGPGNHFWKCLYLSGLVPEPMNCYDDIKLQEFGIGFTNMCARTTKGSSDLKRPEVQEGAAILREKLKEYKPKIAVFNGKGIYETFSGSKKFYFGKQPELIEGTDTIAYVMPSSSARCAQLPRAIDKVPFYEALRRLRDHVVGRVPYLDDADVTFPTLELKNVKKEEPGLKAENDDAGSSGSIGGVPYFNDAKVSAAYDAGDGNVNLTSQQNGSAANTSTPIKQEGRKRGRPKGKGKREEQELRQENQQAMASSILQQTDLQHPGPQVRTQHEQNLYHPQLVSGAGKGGPGIPPNPFSSSDFASLLPAYTASSQLFTTANTPVPSTCSASFVTTVASSSHQDFMSGFYPGSLQFGMVGCPSVVAAPQQQYVPPTEDSSGQYVMQIKSEPVELGAQN